MAIAEDIAALHEILRGRYEIESWTRPIDDRGDPVSWFDVWSVMFEGQASFSDGNIAYLLGLQGKSTSRMTVQRRRQLAIGAVREAAADLEEKIGARRASVVIRVATRMLDRSSHSGRPAAAPPPADDDDDESVDDMQATG